MEILLSAVEENLHQLREEHFSAEKHLQHLEVIDPDGDEIAQEKEHVRTLEHKMAVLTGIVNETPEYEDIRRIAREAFTTLSSESGSQEELMHEVEKLLKCAKTAEVTYIEVVAKIRALKKKAREEDLSQEEVFAELMALERQMWDAQIRQDLFIYMSNRISREMDLEIDPPQQEKEPSVELELN